MRMTAVLMVSLLCVRWCLPAGDFPKPYSAPCVEREDVFEFTEKPVVSEVGRDRYKISFATKGNCDVTVAVISPDGRVVRHLASGVLGPNAPVPFTVNSLKQTLYWDGKDDLGDYPREPGKLRVRVMLGLKPVFDRFLAVTNPKNLPGSVYGMAQDKSGVYVFTVGSDFGHMTVRKFDHDGNFVSVVSPPPGALPEEKLAGRAFIEYEKGKRAHFGPVIRSSLNYEGAEMPGGTMAWSQFRTVVVNNRLYFCDFRKWCDPKPDSNIYYVYTDGSTDVPGHRGRTVMDNGMKFQNLRFNNPHFACSPDGKRLYVAGFTTGGVGTSPVSMPVVLQVSTDGGGPAEIFAGASQAGRSGKNEFVPGSDERGLNSPSSVACDGSGRVYICDTQNNRLQVFAPDGKYLKTIPVDRPLSVDVHGTTGAIYVFHDGTDNGRTVPRLTKIVSFEKPEEEFHVDGIAHPGDGRPVLIGLDTWTAKARFWVASKDNNWGVTIFEEEGKTLRKIVDFDEEMKALGGENHIGRWSGGLNDRVTCDPVREQLYFQTFRTDPWVFDLVSGKKIARVKLPCPNDVAFDRRGYLHVHMDPGFIMPGVVRLDPSRAEPFRDHLGAVYPEFKTYVEVPYDYGDEYGGGKRPLWKGGLTVKDQPGAKYFQDGMGVNMGGDIVVESNIFNIPKMDELGVDAAYEGEYAKVSQGAEARVAYDGRNIYAEHSQAVAAKQKQGEELYYIPRQPGVALAGGTAWLFSRSGKLQQELAVLAGGNLCGVQLDENNDIYVAALARKLTDGKPFLAGRGGTLGTDKPLDPGNVNPFAGVVLKTREKKATFLYRNATTALIPLENTPARPPDIISYSQFSGGEAWLQGFAWCYAGLAPAVPGGCTCPSNRFHLDWYRRTFVPEGYRRSVGVLDANGNLVMHFGRYGNHGDALKMEPGTADIITALPRFISGTDNYLVFEDWGERLVVLKLNYHADEIAAISRQ